MNMDLNYLRPENATGKPVSDFFEDNSILKEVDSKFQVFFRDLECRLIEQIEKAEVIIGCIAWLTSGPILDALADKEHVSIVVQKEDFLRPDIESSQSKSGWKKWLKGKYSNLKSEIGRLEFSNSLYYMSQCGELDMEPIRCVGNLNTDKRPASPRMHNKFILLCKRPSYVIEDKKYTWEEHSIVPYAVWTGSFNFTKNAGRSLENALLLTNEEIVKAYYKEFGQIMAISEPLDWETEWAAPEWRIGT